MAAARQPPTVKILHRATGEHSSDGDCPSSLQDGDPLQKLRAENESLKQRLAQVTGHKRSCQLCFATSMANVTMSMLSASVVLYASAVCLSQTACVAAQHYSSVQTLMAAKCTAHVPVLQSALVLVQRFSSGHGTVQASSLLHCPALRAIPRLTCHTPRLGKSDVSN